MQHTFLRTYSLVLLAILFSNTTAYGQSSDSLKYGLDFQIGGQRKTGVNSQNVLRVASTIVLEKGNVAINNFSNYTYNQVNGGIIADDWDLRTILTLRLNPEGRVRPAVAHNFQSNVLYRMRKSNRAILGLRFIPFKKAPNFTSPAPKKDIVYFENSAHFPFFEEPVRFCDEIIRLFEHTVHQ